MPRIATPRPFATGRRTPARSARDPAAPQSVLSSKLPAMRHRPEDHERGAHIDRHCRGACARHEPGRRSAVLHDTGLRDAIVQKLTRRIHQRPGVIEQQQKSGVPARAARTQYTVRSQCGRRPEPPGGVTHERRFSRRWTISTIHEPQPPRLLRQRPPSVAPAPRVVNRRAGDKYAGHHRSRENGRDGKCGARCGVRRDQRQKGEARDERHREQQ